VFRVTEKTTIGCVIMLHVTGAYVGCGYYTELRSEPLSAGVWRAERRGGTMPNTFGAGKKQ